MTLANIISNIKRLVLREFNKDYRKPAPLPITPNRMQREAIILSSPYWDKKRIIYWAKGAYKWDIVQAERIVNELLTPKSDNNEQTNVLEQRL